MMTVEMTWDEFRTLAYGMYVRDFYEYGGDIGGMDPVCYDEFLDEEYLDRDGMLFMFKNDEREWSRWAKIYLKDPLVKEAME